MIELTNMKNGYGDLVTNYNEDTGSILNCHRDIATAQNA
jgi:hypothetical protein